MTGSAQFVMTVIAIVVVVLWFVTELLSKLIQADQAWILDEKHKSAPTMTKMLLVLSSPLFKIIYSVAGMVAIGVTLYYFRASMGLGGMTKFKHFEFI